MIESSNIHTEPMEERQRKLFEKIDETLADYDRYVLDHQLAIEGIALADKARWQDQDNL